jgi:hypothetical protein
MCCFFLVVFGVIAKIAAIIASIPECVLGGMVSFLFTNIVVSGAKILGPELNVRRNRFITAASLSVALGVALVPHWASNDLVRPAAGTANKVTRGEEEKQRGGGRGEAGRGRQAGKQAGSGGEEGS